MSPHSVSHNTAPFVLNRIAQYCDAVLQSGAGYIGATTAAQECVYLRCTSGPKQFLAWRTSCPLLI